MDFMADCQFFLKMFGYSAYDSIDSLRYRWSGAIYQVMTFLYAYFIGTCIGFVCDSRQPLEERIWTILSVVAFIEQAGAHFTLASQKWNILEFFQHFELVINQSKCAKFIWHSILIWVRKIFVAQRRKDRRMQRARSSIFMWKPNARPHSSKDWEKRISWFRTMC